MGSHTSKVDKVVARNSANRPRASMLHVFGDQVIEAGVIAGCDEKSTGRCRELQEDELSEL